MIYISIDGDDVGRLINSCYLSNNEKKLNLISVQLEESTLNIAKLLEARGFGIVFRAADGVVAKIENYHDFEELFLSIGFCSINQITFSAGVGSCLREAYIALLSSKSNGKNQLTYYDTLK